MPRTPRATLPTCSGRVSDSETEDAPHVPVPIHYAQHLASFSQFSDVVPYLLESSDYKNLTRRIIERFEG